MIERTIKWLIAKDGGQTMQMGPNHQQIIRKIPYPINIAEGYSEQTALMDGITIIQERHRFLAEDRPETISLGTFEVDLKEPSLVISILHSGSMQLYAHDYDQIINRKPNLNLFVRAKKYKISMTLDTEEDIELTLLLIPEKTLKKFLGAKNMQALFETLGLEKGEGFNFYPFPTTISEPLRGCIQNEVDENLRNLFAQTKILQHLFDIGQQISSVKQLASAPEKNKFDVEPVYQYLLKVKEKTPTLSSLGKKFGRPPATLNAEFIKKYKVSIYSFLSNQRLDQAYQAILESDIPMKVLAHRIGYSHVNHFITAFKKKFGVTPGSLRK